MWGREGKPDASSPPLPISCSYTSRKTQNRQASGQPESLTTDKQGIMPSCTLPKTTPNKQIQKNRHHQGVSSSWWEQTPF